MKLDELYVTGLGVLAPEPFSARRAVELGLYDQAAFEENGFSGLCVAGDVSPPEMAVQAARHAYRRSGDDPARIGLVFHAPAFLQGPEIWLPAYYIQREIVGGAVPAYEIRMGCNGIFAALELAACRMAALDRDRTVLVTAAENMDSPLIDRWGVPGFLVGDAASALVLSREPGFARVSSVGSTAVPELEQLHRGGEPLFPPGATSGRRIDMTARAMYFRDNVMDIQRAMELAVAALLDLVGRCLAEAGRELGDVRWLVYNNVARYFMDNLVLAPLGLPIERSTWEFGAGVGHTGASDHVLSLDHLLTTGRLAAGDTVLLAGAGPGYSLSCAVLEVLARPAWAC